MIDRSRRFGGRRGALLLFGVVVLVGCALLAVATPAAAETTTPSPSADTPNGTVSIPDQVTVDRGDVARIPVEMNGTDTAFVAIGDEDTDGFRAIVKVEDKNGDGEVILEANTYNLLDQGVSPAVRYRAATNDSVELVRPAPDYDAPLPAPDGARGYRLEVATQYDRSADALGGATDRSVLRVYERTTNGLTMWTAPAETALDSASAIRSARADGTLTENSTVENRTAVATIDATGLSGALRAANASTTERFLSLVDTGEVEFTVSLGSGNPIGPNGIDRDALRVISDAETDRVSLVLPPGTIPSGVTGVAFTVPEVSSLARDDASGDRTVETSIDVGGAGEVRPDPDPDSSIAVENSSVVRGDVATIPISVGDRDRVTVRVGSDRAGWERIVRVADRDDDGAVRLRLNTYTAGDADPRTAIEAVGEDSVVDVRSQFNSFDRALGAGTDGSFVYRVTAHERYDATNDTFEGDHGVGALRVERRSTEGIAIYHGSESIYETAQTGTAVRTAIENGSLDREQRVTGATVVAELQATGLAGALRAANGSTTTERFFAVTDGDPATFAIETSSGTPLGPADTLGLSPDDPVRVEIDPATGHVYVLFDRVDLGLSGASDYWATLGIPESGPLAPVDGSSQNATRGFALGARDGPLLDSWTAPADANIDSRADLRHAIETNATRGATVGSGTAIVSIDAVGIVPLLDQQGGPNATANLVRASDDWETGLELTLLGVPRDPNAGETRRSLSNATHAITAIPDRDRDRLYLAIDTDRLDLPGNVEARLALDSGSPLPGAPEDALFEDDSPRVTGTAVDLAAPFGGERTVHARDGVAPTWWFAAAPDRPVTLTVTDADGQTVASAETTAGTGPRVSAPLDLAGVDPGRYTLTIAGPEHSRTHSIAVVAPVHRPTERTLAGTATPDETVAVSVGDRETTATAGRDGVWTTTMDLSGLSPGRYDLTAGNSSRPIIVEASDGPSATIESDRLTEHQGDVAEIPVTLDGADAASVRIASPQDVYDARVRVADRDGDGTVRLAVNTFTAGNTSTPTNVSYWARGEDSVTAVDQRPMERVGALAVGPTGRTDDDVTAMPVVDGQLRGQADRATLRLEAPGEPTVRGYAGAPSLDDVSVDDIQTGAAGRVFESSRAPTNGTAILELQADGIEGAIEARARRGDTLPVIVPVYYSTDGRQMGSISILQDPVPIFASVEWPVASIGGGSGSPYRVVSRPDTGQYYVFLDVSEPTGSAESIDMHVGTRNASTGAADHLIPDGDDFLSTDWSMWVEETVPDVNESALVDMDDRSYDPAPNQTVSGTTTLPPGTELVVYLESDLDSETGSAFLTEARAVVAPDGTWSTTVDLSDGVEGQDFSIEFYEPSVTPDEFDTAIESTSVSTDRTALPRERTTLSGTSTFGAGDSVQIALYPSLDDRGSAYGDTPVRAVWTTVGTDGDWTAEFDLSALADGRYRLRATANGSAAWTDVTVGDPPGADPIVVRNYRRASTPTDELSPSALMDAKGDYLSGAISLESAVTVMRAYFFG
ncbi:DUF7827 domain-containing protein [Halococcoides cellulosivorans]|uniref:DUF7827 domain-containing protein n=1 Tax=Halococcoides cellulosivorans TaxID=1679096 RepID=A0A2R4X2R9_9EURY|nr:BGTF surface domain-containing protein [Halococcoides cellulosivorans]AWB28088.1 hypothetical protein HARCEL1_10410 [Halococcoides cellulosivorans]